MKISENEKLYCSLDIETSGFDPLTNEILEVGFAFFTLTEQGIKIVEEWTQVFNPSKPVSPQILGLTGISQKELDEAPKFSEYVSLLQEKLGKAVIVGHNVIFDIKFLQSFGIKFSGEVVDTLDLVQFILPTHHSYNLENLMHTFGISHKEAHRALADSKAAISLLEKLLQVYSSFSESLKNDINKLLTQNEFIWKDLLNVRLPAFALPHETKDRANKKDKTGEEDFKFTNKVIYNFPLGQQYVERVAASLKNSKKKSLLVLPKAQQALDLQKKGLADAVFFLPQLNFNNKKFGSFLKRGNLTPEEVKFLLKVLVWRETNWQTETFLDLNLSFFGGQFKELICCEELTENTEAKVLACDQAVFLQSANKNFYSDRQVIICGLNEFESAVTSDIGTKASWSYILYLLKSYYNPEFNSGLEKFKDSVEDGLAASDLFFGLINALLQTDPPSFQYYKISPEVEYQENYQKIKGAVGSYTAKLEVINNVLNSESIKEFIENLNKFFSTEDNMVKWIELAENRCALLSMPINIQGLVENILEKFNLLSFVDSLTKEILPEFFIGRLGLKDFSLKNFEASKNEKTKEQPSKQGDLFSSIKKVFSGKDFKVRCHFVPSAANPEYLLELVGGSKSLPAAVLFSSPMQTREFYDNNYQGLKKFASVLAQTGSGGTNKIFRNFSINENGLLLATDKFILKHLKGVSQVEPVDKLPVKLLVLCRLPFEQFTHPYQEAISASFENPFMDYALPRALFNFHSLISFFYTPLLQDIYVIDSKLGKDYAAIFKNYYKSIPGAELKA